MKQNQWKNPWPWVAMGVVVAVTAFLLHNQGRLWRCTCGRIILWAGEAWGPETSQHWFDPYSLTHMLHGVAFCGLLTLLLPRLAIVWRLFLGVVLESAWEVIENSAWVINRYREGTASLGYTGDTVINSVGDIIACGLGLVLAWRLGWRRSILLVIIVEAVLLLWIRDSLILNIIMLIHPIDAIKEWQTRA